MLVFIGIFCPKLPIMTNHYQKNAKVIGKNFFLLGIVENLAKLFDTKKNQLKTSKNPTFLVKYQRISNIFQAFLHARMNFCSDEVGIIILKKSAKINQNDKTVI